MPIYAYRCEHCGHAKDVLQKVSDPVLVVCPACGQSTFRKQVTAAGFQLKGSGWYVTDFRGDGKGGRKPAGEGDAAAKSSEGDAGKNGGEAAKPDAAASPAPSSGDGGAPAAAPKADKPAPAPSPAPASPSGSKSD